MKKEAQHFQTFDLNLAAVLLAQGFVLEEVKKNPNGKSLFIFDDSESLKKLVEMYWKGEVKMNPQDIFTSLKVIKNRLYSSYS